MCAAMSLNLESTLRRTDVRRRLVSIALRAGARNRADAEDCVQDALAIAFEKLGSLKDPTRIDPWLSQIVVNATRMHLRARKRLRRGGDLVQVEAEEENLPTNVGAEDQLIHLEALARLKVAIANDSDGEILHAYLTRPRTLRELAQQRGQNLGMLRTRIRRLRQRLHAVMDAAG